MSKRALLSTLLSSPPEVHAAVYGVAIGYAMGTDNRLVRLGLLGLVFGGEDAVDVAGRPSEELRTERQYAIGGALVGVRLAQRTRK